jgi:hypothetical protein
MKNIIGIGNYIKSSNDTGGIVISQQLRDKVLAACIPTGNNDSPDRERVKDLSGNGNDFILSNFKFTDNQGYGSYPWNFSSFINANGTHEVTIGSWESTWNIIVSKEFPETLIEVSGLNGSGPLMHSYKGSTTGSSTSYMSIHTNGRHRLPISYVNDAIKDSYGFRNESNSTVKIKIIPEYEGAVVLNTNVLLNSKVGTITSEKNFVDIIGDNKKFTIISFIVPMGKALSGGSYWSYVRNVNNSHLLRISKAYEVWFKPFILAQRHDYESAPVSADYILALGDKSDAYIAENTFTSLEDMREATYYSVSGFTDIARDSVAETGSCAWYGTIITKDYLTEDEIIQLVQYYNLDKNIKPIIYYDIDKQRPSDGELDKLIDYSLNDNDAKVIGVTLPNKDFPGEVVFGRGKYAVLNKELNLLDSTLVLDREYKNTGQFTPVISNSESDYSTDTPFLMEHFSINEVWSYGQHTNIAINTNRAVTYLSRFIYHNSNYYVNINVGNSTGGSGLCIGGKVNDQINGDMFFHKLLLYPYSMHVDLLKRQLKKLKIENNF